MLLEDHIINNKFNLVLILNDQSSIIKIESVLKHLHFGQSNVFIECFVERKLIKIKVKENIKLSSKLLHELSKINGIKNIRYT